VTAESTTEADQGADTTVTTSTRNAGRLKVRSPARRCRCRPGGTGRGGRARWLSTKQASAWLGITPRTLYRLIDEGQLPAYRFGRVIRLTQGELEAFVAAQRIKPGDLANLYPGGLETLDGDQE